MTSRAILSPWLLAALLIQSAHLWDSDVRLPPSIVDGLPKHMLFKTHDIISLDCYASGSPVPNYDWYKDGSYLDLNSNDHIYRDTSKPGYAIIINGADSALGDEGYYQCLAINSYGTAMTDVLFLQAATLDMTSGSEVVPYHSEPGHSLIIPCDRRDSIPDASFSWVTGTEAFPIPVVFGRRVNIDGDGNLYFSYVKPEDQQITPSMYRCNIKNQYLDWTVGTSYSTLTVNGNDAGQDVAPQNMFRTGDGATVIGLYGEELRIGCFFSGKAEVSVDWSRSSSSSLPPHHSKENYNLELSIDPVQLSDEDTYTCTGSNNVGSATAQIQVKIEVIPMFEEPDYPGPTNVNASEGDNVAFYCMPMAIPVASIAWYVNGQPFEDANLNQRFRLSDDGTMLNVSEVCKNCDEAGHLTDLMNIQCNASNVHGYVFSEGYLNVLERTELTVTPPASTDIVVGEGEEIILPCEATTDHSTVVTIEWLHYDKAFENEAGVRVVDDVTSYLHVWTETLEVAEYVMGKYTCRATNGYSVAEAEAYLVIPGYGEVTTSSMDMWWILIIIAVILIAVILLLCLLLYYQRNKGADYLVDEKERAQGNDPEKELDEGGFHDYQRPPEPVPKPNMTLGSSHPYLASSYHNLASSHPQLGNANPAYIASMADIDLDSMDGESMAEYGDIDPMKFNEDGSFIGEYNTVTQSRQQLNVQENHLPYESNI